MDAPAPAVDTPVTTTNAPDAPAIAPALAVDAPVTTMDAPDAPAITVESPKNAPAPAIGDPPKETATDTPEPAVENTEIPKTPVPAPNKIGMMLEELLCDNAQTLILLMED